MDAPASHHSERPKVFYESLGISSPKYGCVCGLETRRVGSTRWTAYLFLLSGHNGYSFANAGLYVHLSLPHFPGTMLLCILYSICNGGFSHFLVILSSFVELKKAMAYATTLVRGTHEGCFRCFSNYGVKAFFQTHA